MEQATNNISAVQQSTSRESTPEQSKDWIGVLLGLIVIAVLVWFFVFKEDDDAPSEGGAPREGGASSKGILKTQIMTNATTHTVTHGNKDIELGLLAHSGILKRFQLTAMAKEQGWGNQCSSFELNVMRDGKSIASISQDLGRNKEYKQFSLDPEVVPGTFVQVGDSVIVTIKGLWPRCAAWITDIVVSVTILV